MQVSVVGWNNTDENEAITKQIQDSIAVIACQSLGDMVVAGYYYPKAQATLSARYAIKHPDSDSVLILGENNPWVAYAILSGKNVVIIGDISDGVLSRVSKLADRVGLMCSH